MNAAKFSRSIVTTVVVCLLVSCSGKRDGTPADKIATGAESDETPQQIVSQRPLPKVAATSLPHSATEAIAPEDASNHVGQTRTVCGMVASARYATRTKGQPTFLNLNRAYPNQIFTVVIWGSDRPEFPEPPESFYRGKRISVTGRIVEYRGKLQMVVNSPSQISVIE